MKTLLALIKIQLNINFGISALKYRFTKERGKFWESILVLLSAAVGISFLTLTFGAMMFGVFIAGKSVGKPELTLVIGFVSSQIVVSFFGLFYIISAFYFSRDMDLLVPLPVKPSSVLGAKFAVVMVNEYLTLIPVLGPALLIYGLLSGQGVLYWLKAGVLFVLSPVIPLTLGSLFAVLLMRFVNLRKNKDLLAVIGGFAGLAIGLGSNYFVQRIPKTGEEAFFKNLLRQTDLFDMIGSKFPPGLWAALGLSRPGIEGVGYFALFIGLCVLLVFLLMFLGNRFFYKSVLSGQEVVRRRRAVPIDAWGRKRIGSVTPLMALLVREWRLFFRTPVFVMNGITGAIMGPFMIIVTLFGKDRQSSEIFLVLNNPQFALPVALAAVGLMLFAGGMNITASTALSREGAGFWISKMIPVTPRIQVAAKLLHSSVVAALCMAATGVALMIFIKLVFWRLLVAFILGILGSVLITVLGLLIDILRPKLEWTNPQEAVKSNLNGFLGIMVTFAVIGILALASVLLILGGLHEGLVYTLLGAVIIAAAVPLILGLFALADRRYKGLET